MFSAAWSPPDAAAMRSCQSNALCIRKPAMCTRGNCLQCKRITRKTARIRTITSGVQNHREMEAKKTTVYGSGAATVYRKVNPCYTRGRSQEILSAADWAAHQLPGTCQLDRLVRRPRGPPRQMLKDGVERRWPRGLR